MHLEVRGVAFHNWTCSRTHNMFFNTQVWFMHNLQVHQAPEWSDRSLANQKAATPNVLCS